MFLFNLWEDWSSGMDIHIEINDQTCYDRNDIMLEDL
jgi:hypothetical protein